MKTELCLALATLLLCCSEVRSACEKVDSCSCRDSESGEVLSLAALAHTDNTAALSAKDGSTDYEYLYNPCLPFTAAAGTQCVDVAICQEDSHAAPLRYYDLGNQSTSNFTVINGSLNLVYTGQPTFAGKPRVSRIQLICDEDATTPEFKFVSEPVLGEYSFTLRSECACPGKCKPMADKCVPDDQSKCSCKFTDGRRINIRSLNQPNAPTIVRTPTATVTLNPCTGVNVGPGVTECRDVTVCLQQSGSYLDYGYPDNVEYTTTQEDNVVLTYKSKDEKRRTNIQLVCDEGQRHVPKVTIQGEPSATELNLELRSVCACPNGCLNPHVNCDRIDDCSCRLEDGSGTVSLHDLDNPVAPLSATSVDKWNTSYNYYYNPCTKFTAPEPNMNCTDVAVCQIIRQNSEDFNLGLQEGVTFRVSNSDTETVVFKYIHGGDDRTTFLQLICNATREIPLYEFIEEEPFKTYYFSLESKDACMQRSHQQPEEIVRKRLRTRI